MRRITCLVVFATAFSLAVGGAPVVALAQSLPAPIATPVASTAAATDDSAQLEWPRTFTVGDVTFQLFQPQVEKWADNRLDARAAIAAMPATAPAAAGASGIGDQSKQTFGVIWVTARTEVDKVNRIVSLEDLQVTKASFPQAAAREQEYLAMIRTHAADKTREVPLDHLEANLTATQDVQAAQQAVPVKNDPPKVIFSKTPALLVMIDGTPSLRAVEGAAKLMRVMNTRPLLLLDETTNLYYLHVMNRWAQAPTATGPFTPAYSVRPELEQVKQTLAKAGTVDLLDPANPAGAPPELPTIYVSTTPAELIQTVGEPEYAPIASSNLLYVTNTDSALFKQMPGDQFYALISGRWFSSTSLEGPWAFVDGKALPADFAKIPPDSPKANVLVSIPGTPEAKEAVIANSIPQTATVNIAETHLTVTYDGTPKFKKIDGANGLSYAVNTALPVIRIDESNAIFCVQNGIWFEAKAPTGPWAVATAVPGILYTIPLSSPVHYVTYVRIYGFTRDVVYVGYTPGYMGTCVSNGVVVYGTGYYYPAYVGTVWVGYPPTYGYGAGFACGAATGFAFGFAAGAIIGNCWSQPYWGPCWGAGSININTHSVYGNWRGGVTSVNRHYSYDPYTGKSASTGRGASFNPYTGRASVGGYSNYVNRESGNYNLQRGGATYNPNTGVVRAGGKQATGNIYDGTLDVNTAGGRYNTKTDTGIAKSKDGDIYASKDGNVYRRTDDGWQQRSGDSWQSAERPTPNASANTNSNLNSFSQQRDSLESQRSSRDLGQQRFDSSRSTGGYQRTGGGGGGRMGGGGRGRR